MNKLIIFLYVLWFVLNMADAGLTQYALSHGCVEANPIPCWLINHGGWVVAWLFKIAMSFAFIGILSLFDEYEWKFKLGCALFGCLTLGAVVVSNIYTIMTV